MKIALVKNIAVKWELLIINQITDWFIESIKNKPAYIKKLAEIIGGPSEDRTRDFLLAKQTLSQLSYRPVVSAETVVLICVVWTSRLWCVVRRCVWCVLRRIFIFSYVNAVVNDILSFSIFLCECQFLSFKIYERVYVFYMYIISIEYINQLLYIILFNFKK